MKSNLYILEILTDMLLGFEASILYLNERS